MNDKKNHNQMGESLRRDPNEIRIERQRHLVLIDGKIAVERATARVPEAVPTSTSPTNTIPRSENTAENNNPSNVEISTEHPAPETATPIVDAEQATGLIAQPETNELTDKEKLLAEARALTASALKEAA